MNVLFLSSSDGIALTLMRCLGLGSPEPVACHLLSIWPSQGFANRSRYCQRSSFFEVADFSKATIDQAVEVINDHCVRWDIDVVVPAGLWGTYFLALFQDRLKVKSFPVPRGETLRQLNDKGRFSELMEQLEIPIPRTSRLEAMDDDCQGWSYPVVIKPTSGGHSQGVKVLSSPEEYLSYQAAMDPRHRFILQEYIEGFDLVFGFIAELGVLRAWTLHRKGSGKVHFIADEGIFVMAQKIIGATGYHGVGNLDLRWDQRRQRFLIIECNPRFWGSVGISRYFGVDFLRMGFAMLALASPPQAPASERHDAIVMPYPNPIRHGLALRMDRRGLHPGHLPSFAWRELLDPRPTLLERGLRFLNVTALDDNEMLHPEAALIDLSDLLRPLSQGVREPLEIPFSEYVP